MASENAIGLTATISDLIALTVVFQRSLHFVINSRIVYDCDKPNRLSGTEFAMHTKMRDLSYV